MKKVAIFAYDGCWAMSVFSTADFFRIVSLLDKHIGKEQSYEVEILSVTGEEVKSASGYIIRPDGAITDNKFYDLIVIPAFEGIRLVEDFTPNAEFINWLQNRKLEGANLLAITTGAVFIAATGLVNNILLATHWAFIRQLKKIYPVCNFVAHPSYLSINGIWSTGSLSGNFDALLKILANDYGDQFMQLCATHLLVATPEHINPILPDCRNHCDEAILKLQGWIEAHHAENILIEHMRQEVDMSERTLKRRFLLATGISPNHYIQMVRIDKAKKLLLSTNLSIKMVAYKVGYENVSFFSKIFKKRVKQTPAQWRNCTVAGIQSRNIHTIY